MFGHVSARFSVGHVTNSVQIPTIDSGEADGGERLKVGGGKRVEVARVIHPTAALSTHESGQTANLSTQPTPYPPNRRPIHPTDALS
jgi:hypothetical protein